MEIWDKIKQLPNADEIDFDTFNALSLVNQVRYYQVQLGEITNNLDDLTEKVKRLTNLTTPILNKLNGK